MAVRVALGYSHHVNSVHINVAFRGISNDKYCTARGLCIITTILQANIGMIIVLISVIVDSVVDFIASRSGPAHWLLPGDGESGPLQRSTDVIGRLSPCRGLHSAPGYGPPQGCPTLGMGVHMHV